MQPRSASTHSKTSCRMRPSSSSMSSVWLTASDVRYITWRLLRARASQRLCESSGVARAIESSSRIVRTIRDPSAVLVVGTMSTAANDAGSSPSLA